MSMYNIYAFISLWDENLGPTILKSYPKSNEIPFDLELISSKIFFAFQDYYTSTNEKQQIKKTYIKLTINEINRKAVVLFDSIEKRKKEESIQQIFIIVVLFPAHLSDNELDKFKDIIDEIDIEYTTTENVFLDNYISKIEEIYYLEERSKDSDIRIDEEYTINQALLDLKRGIELFSKNKFDHAYNLLKKAYLKFKAQGEIKLLLESLFFLSSTLSQLKKYLMAHEYIEELESLSHQLLNHKYYELSLFMGGFCFYKREEYEKALEKFKKLESSEILYIDKINFFFLYGRILRLLESYSKALIPLEKALEMISLPINSKKLIDNKAYILIELGHVHYAIAVNNMSSAHFDQNSVKCNLQKTIEYYQKAVGLLKDKNSFNDLILIYRLIGNIYDLFSNFELAIKNYKNALTIAEEINDVPNRLQLFNLIIQNLSKLRKYEEIVKETDEMLAKIISYAYLDLYTISNYHQQLGEALFKLGKHKDALSEFLIALNIYNRFDETPSESLDLLKSIVEIYKKYDIEDKIKYIDYYQEKYYQIAKNLEDSKFKKEIGFDLLKDIKEFWIFAHDGTQLYSYTPETKFNPELFGGFLIALQNFGKELAAQSLKSITIGFSRYTFYSENQYFFVLGRSSVKSLLYNIKYHLKLIHNEFLDNYRHVFQENNGKSDKFSSFFEKLKIRYKFENDV